MSKEVNGQLASSTRKLMASASAYAKTHLHLLIASTFSFFFFSGFLLFLLLLACPLLLSVAAAPAANRTQRQWLPAHHLNRDDRPPPVKPIQIDGGDLIDCVPSHLQPAFNHPKLRGQKPLDPPERPARGFNLTNTVNEVSLQAWASSFGVESCPLGTVPIRRSTQQDILRASNARLFGKKPVRRDSSGSDHEHAVGYVTGDRYYGAKASLSVWAPAVMSVSEFSLSQIWLISGSFGNDLNTIEAGWQVSPELHGDGRPRFFTYWTSDAYRETGCYNLLCSGFVQTSNKIALGAPISPTSVLNGVQFDIDILIWKDPKHGHWWLQFGSDLVVGYWPAFLFSHLANHADMVQFGGETVNTRSLGLHTSTQMGSGHFAEEGFRRASYFRNLQLVDWDNNLIPLSNLRLLADHSNCYSIRGGANRAWGSYFYYGGPGENMRCR